MPDSDEYAFQFQVGFFPGLDVADTYPGDAALIPFDFFQHVVPVNGDIACSLFLKKLALQYFFCTQFIPAVHQYDFTGDIGKVQRLFHRGVPAPDHRDLLTPVEEPVTGSAGADAFSHVRLLGGQAQVARGGAGGDDQGVTTVTARIALHPERSCVQVNLVDVIKDNLGLEALGMTAHPLHQVRPLQALHVAGPVVHVGGSRQLASHLHAGNQYRTQVGPRGIHGRRISGRPRTQDQDSCVFNFRHDGILFVRR